MIKKTNTEIIVLINAWNENRLNKGKKNLMWLEKLIEKEEEEKVYIKHEKTKQKKHSKNAELKQI